MGRTAGLGNFPVGPAVGRPAGGSALFDSSQEASTKATNSLVGITSESTFDFVGVSTPTFIVLIVPAFANTRSVTVESAAQAHATQSETYINTPDGDHLMLCT